MSLLVSRPSVFLSMDVFYPLKEQWDGPGVGLDLTLKGVLSLWET